MNKHRLDVIKRAARLAEKADSRLPVDQVAILPKQTLSEDAQEPKERVTFKNGGKLLIKD